ncbi:MAG TPA: hypothetical protein PLD25_31780 [Chloroflexota bacterium]|nr:hypothetical protein [Chloroflexota bacterium]HUM70219.1 hypothetical protein [Chloroflexota bacterium]
MEDGYQIQKKMFLLWVNFWVIALITAACQQTKLSSSTTAQQTPQVNKEIATVIVTPEPTPKAPTNTPILTPTLQEESRTTSEGILELVATEMPDTTFSESTTEPEKIKPRTIRPSVSAVYSYPTLWELIDNLQELLVPGEQSHNVTIFSDTTWLLFTSWCTDTEERLLENLEAINLEM